MTEEGNANVSSIPVTGHVIKEIAELQDFHCHQVIGKEHINFS